MKAAGCFAVFVFCGMLLAAFAGLMLLRAFPPQAAEPEPPHATGTPAPVPSPPSDGYLSYVPRLGRFHRDEIGGRFQLDYGFIDHQGRTHDVRCEVARADWQRESDRFGYDETELHAELNRRLRVLADQELQRRGLIGLVTMRIYGNGAYEAKPEFPGGANAAEDARRAAELQRFYAWLDGEFEKQSEAIQVELFRARGFRLENHKYYLDYRGIALRNTEILSDCFRALAEAGSGYDARQYLGMFTAFIQEIPYQLPPDLVGRKKTIGLWVPTEVLVGDHGDCDSKSVTFAALWRNFEAPVVLIDLPQHMLVAVEVKPGPGENFVRIGNRYFVLCEVAGPGKLHPGRDPISGQFEYVMIPPAGAERSRNRRRVYSSKRRVTKALRVASG